MIIRLGLAYGPLGISSWDSIWWTLLGNENGSLITHLTPIKWIETEGLISFRYV